MGIEEKIVPVFLFLVKTLNWLLVALLCVYYYAYKVVHIIRKQSLNSKSNILCFLSLVCHFVHTYSMPQHGFGV